MIKALSCGPQGRSGRLSPKLSGPTLRFSPSRCQRSFAVLLSAGLPPLTTDRSACRPDGVLFGWRRTPVAVRSGRLRGGAGSGVWAATVSVTDHATTGIATSANRFAMETYPYGFRCGSCRR